MDLTLTVTGDEAAQVNRRCTSTQAPGGKRRLSGLSQLVSPIKTGESQRHKSEQSPSTDRSTMTKSNVSGRLRKL